MVSGSDIDCLEEGYPEKVLQLLRNKTHLHFEDDNTPLHIASYFGNVKLVECLLEHYPQYLNTLNRYGWSPLMQACREGHYHCAKLLLESKADPCICNLLGVNALTIATRGGHDKIINLLFDHDVHIQKDEIYDEVENSLHLAVLLSRDDIVKILIRRGINSNCRNKFTHWTPLMTAAMSGEICTARLLFKHDADGQLCNTAGMSAHQIAKRCKHEECASFIQRKANQSLSNSGDNRDNIITAVKHGDEKQVLALLDENPEIANSHTKDAATPLMYASMSGRINLVEILLKSGADIDAKDYENGWTALMQATYYDQTEIAKYLIMRGANVNLRAKNGITALDMAMLINLNDTELFRMLANRAIESANSSKVHGPENKPPSSCQTERSFLKKISKSLKNNPWYRSVTDLNGTMIAPKSEADIPNREKVFSPLHTCVLGRVRNDDLPDLTPPDFSKSIKKRGDSRENRRPRINTKLLLDGSANSSKSSSGSGGMVDLCLPQISVKW